MDWWVERVLFPERLVKGWHKSKWFSTPWYSDNIAAAWEVVGRILETWLIEINTIDESLGPDMVPQITWSVTIAEEYNSGGSAIWRGDFADFVEADTAPLAICRAAIKASV